MKKFAAFVPIVVPLIALGALMPATSSSAAPTSGSAGSAVPVRSLGTSTAAEKAQQEKKSIQSDAATIARQTKRSVAQVTADLSWQQKVTSEAERLAQRYPTTFTGVRILSHEKRTVWVGFTGAAPKVNLPDRTAATVASDQPMSSAEIQQAAERVAKKAKTSFGAEAAAVPDIVAGSIDVVVAKSKPKAATADRAISRLTSDTVGTGNDAPRLKVSFDARATSKNEAATGGAKLEYVGTGSLECTSAFSIIKNGATGMLTAQHCTSAFSHENYNGGTEYSAWTVASTLGGNGDLRWYNTSTNEVPQFRADYSDLRNLNTAPGFSEGQWMCHFGYGNGKSCDTVYRVGVSSGGVSGLTAMSHHYTTGGNSGGPWFYNNGGYGVHRGYTTIWFQERSVFTPLNRVMPAFGAYILVN